MAKPKVNYWVDVVVGGAFSVSAVSGLVFLLPVISPDSVSVLGLSYRVWDTLHLWSSLAMIAGVLTHLVLHSKWIVGMTQKAFGLGKRRPTRDPDARPMAAGSVVSRRRFLTLGAGMLAVGAILAGGSAVARAVARALEFGADGDTGEAPALKSATGKGSIMEASAVATGRPGTGAAEQEGVTGSPGEPTPAPPTDGISLGSATPTPEATVEVEAVADPTETSAPAVEMCVACPKGVMNDPYPGRCRRYVDRDNDGLCDASIPTPCG